MSSDRSKRRDPVKILGVQANWAPQKNVHLQDGHQSLSLTPMEDYVYVLSRVLIKDLWPSP